MIHYSPFTVGPWQRSPSDSQPGDCGFNTHMRYTGFPPLTSDVCEKQASSLERNSVNPFPNDKF